MGGTSLGRAAFVWGVPVAAVVVALAFAATSPQLAWRQPVYVVAGFAGVVGLAMLLFQPLLAGGYLPGVSVRQGRRAHRWIGAGLMATVAVHVAGLWLTSPPDVIDALLFTSPTPFSAWGVIAMWALVATAVLATMRHRLRIRPLSWRMAHAGLALVTVAGTVVHALLIEGTMEPVSKAVLCALTIGTTLRFLVSLTRSAWRARQG